MSPSVATERASRRRRTIRGMGDTTSFDPTIFIVIGLAGGLLSGAIASSKGLPFFGYFVIGCLLPLIGIVIALATTGPGKLGQLTPAPSEGWHRDPTGRFEHRYFDGHHWTRHVGRGGQQFEDPL